MLDPETQALIKHYYQNPQNNYQLDDFTVKKHEGNSICGDDITVFLKIENDIVTDYSFTGNTSMITTAAASYFSELIINQNISEIEKRNYQTIQDSGFKVSPRRKRAAVIALLASINAIQKYKKTTKQLNFEDILD